LAGPQRGVVRKRFLQLSLPKKGGERGERGGKEKIKRMSSLSDLIASSQKNIP